MKNSLMHLRDKNSTEKKVVDRGEERRIEAHRSDSTHTLQKRRRIFRESHGSHGCIEFLAQEALA